jgi:hypothetical protein
MLKQFALAVLVTLLVTNASMQTPTLADLTRIQIKIRV